MLEGEPRRIRFHDYSRIYSLPGLYEQLFYDELRCSSPRTISAVLAALVQSEGEDPGKLKVLDVGAGNGTSGEELAARGIRSITAVDILEEAADAARRDRPELYEEYVVADLTDLPEGTRRRLVEKRFDCLTVVAALSFGGFSPLAFAEAYNLISSAGWACFNLKRALLEDPEPEGIAALVKRMLDEGLIEERASVRYRHRLSMRKEPLYYVAVIARKRSDVPRDWAQGL